jgi:hypothetical protein
VYDIVPCPGKVPGADTVIRPSYAEVEADVLSWRPDFTDIVPPTAALFVTERAVLLPLRVSAPLNVGSPANVPLSVPPPDRVAALLTFIGSVRKVLVAADQLEISELVRTTAPVLEATDWTGAAVDAAAENPVMSDVDSVTTPVLPATEVTGAEVKNEDVADVQSERSECVKVTAPVRLATDVTGALVRNTDVADDQSLRSECVSVTTPVRPATLVTPPPPPPPLPLVAEVIRPCAFTVMFALV